LKEREKMVAPNQIRFGFGTGFIQITRGSSARFEFSSDDTYPAFDGEHGMGYDIPCAVLKTDDDRREFAEILIRAAKFLCVDAQEFKTVLAEAGIVER